MSRKVKCQFVCESVTNYQTNKTAKFRAVSSNEDENSDFTKFTPAGNIEVTICNDAPASDVFTPGKKYFVEFSETE